MHISVMLEEAVQNLNLKENSVVVDCTLGYGGHSSLILKQIPKGFLYAIDQDEEAINSSKNRLDKIGNNYKIIKSNFSEIGNIFKDKKVDAILYDLGVSSPQLDEIERGFSFHNDAVLDMRMDKNNSKSALNVVNEYSYKDLVRILKEYGEEKYATSIANNIIKNRPITKTLQLVEVIKKSVPEKYKRDHHPARKTFQAIRIEVNNELGVFEKSLNDALELININGRICVITFHSLEDKICKNIFKKVTSIDSSLQKLPVIPDMYAPKFKIIGSFTPNVKDIDDNNRSRSARLRVIERIK